MSGRIIEAIKAIVMTLHGIHVDTNETGIMPEWVENLQTEVMTQPRCSLSDRRPSGRAVQRIIMVAAIAAWLTPRPLTAQTSIPGPPVEVTVTPRLARVGAPVTISGLTYVDGKRLQVSITVHSPDPVPPITLTAKAGVKDGTFSRQFTDTKTPGKYRVTAISPDGKGKGETTFTVATAGGIAARVTEAMDEVVAVSEEALDRAMKNVQPVPPSSVAQELNEQLEAIAEQLDATTKPRADISEALEALIEAASTDPKIQDAIDEDLRDVIDWADESDEEVRRMRERLKDPPQEVSLCDRIELANEGLVTLSTALVFTSRGTTTLLFKLFMNNVLPALVNEAPQLEPLQKSTLTEGIRIAVGAAEGFQELVDAGNDLLNNATQILLKEVFPMYCTKFEGPITANLDVTFFHKGQEWWNYSVQLDGRLVLRHSNNTQPGQPVRLTGEFEGNATDFSFSEDIGVVDPPRAGGAVILRKRITPIGFVDTSKDPFGVGLFIRMATPGYFYIPVEGELVKDRVVLTVLDARADFSDVVKNRLIMIYVPPVLPIPIITTFDFPIQKAHFILSRGMGKEGAPEFKVTEEGEKQVIARTFERNEQPGGTEVNFNVVVQACTPSCY